jgi:hypothetical protein
MYRKKRHVTISEIKKPFAKSARAVFLNLAIIYYALQTFL